MQEQHIENKVNTAQRFGSLFISAQRFVWAERMQPGNDRRSHLILQLLPHIPNAGQNEGVLLGRLDRAMQEGAGQDSAGHDMLGQHRSFRAGQGRPGQVPQDRAGQGSILLGRPS